MKKRVSWALGLCALLGTLGAAKPASAQCCPGHTLTTSCTTQPTKSRWCIANDAPNGFGTETLPEVFCTWGDQVVSTLESTFNIQAPGIFEFDLMTCESNGRTNCTAGESTGGAQTPTDCGTFGNSVTYDAFTGSAYGAQYFWGYLLSLHEAINQWTGLASGGWPTDWWADHVSAFPNLMDFHIMNVIGTANMDSNLLLVGTAQKARFYPNGDSADPRVVALDTVYGMMPQGDGLKGFSKVFALVSGDQMNWGSLGTNPNQKLSEYVLSYIALAVGGQGGQVLPTVQGPSANGGGNICNGFQDANMDPTYTCNEADIDGIANAHCGLAANGRPSTDLQAYQMGNFASVKTGPCGSTCPAECACDTASNTCLAPWIANGGVGTDAGDEGGTGSSSGGVSNGSSSGGGVSEPDASGSSSGSSSGGGTLAGSSSGSTTVVSGDAGDSGNGATIPTSSSGCGCATVGRDRSSPLGIFAVSALGVLALVRIRSRVGAKRRPGQVVRGLAAPRIRRRR